MGSQPEGRTSALYILVWHLEGEYLYDPPYLLPDSHGKGATQKHGVTVSIPAGGSTGWAKVLGFQVIAALSVSSLVPF